MQETTPPTTQPPPNELSEGLAKGADGPPVTLDAIGAVKPRIAQKEEDTKDVLEQLNAGQIALQIQYEKHEQSIKDKEADRNLRGQYAEKVIRFLYCYCIISALILLLDGWSVEGFSLPGTVLLALTGSTAIAAIGLVGFVAKGLFPQAERNQKSP